MFSELIFKYLIVIICIPLYHGNILLYSIHWIDTNPTELHCSALKYEEEAWMPVYRNPWVVSHAGTLHDGEHGDDEDNDVASRMLGIWQVKNCFMACFHCFIVASKV